MYHTHQTVKIYCFLYSSLMISVYLVFFYFQLKIKILIRAYTVYIIHTQFNFYPLPPLKTNKRTDRQADQWTVYIFFPLLLPIIAVLTHSNLTIFDWMTPMRIKYDVSVAPNVHIISVCLVLYSSFFFFFLFCCFWNDWKNLRGKNTHRMLERQLNQQQKFKANNVELSQHHLFMCTVHSAHLYPI